MFSAILKSLRTGVVTRGYPSERSVPPEQFRGAPAIATGGPFAALPEPSVCPVGAISQSGGTLARYALDLGRCVFCGLCESSVAGNPIAIGREFELAALRRTDLVVEVVRDADGLVAASPDSGKSADRVAASIRALLGRSLHLRHLDAGSCNGCDWELTALLNAFHDVRRLGIDFVASPRHADGVIVTGSGTRNLELAVRRTYDAVPDPKIVIAVGACAISGGIAGRSYASAGGIGELLPVDVFIPGCPPRPEAIIFDILVALGRLDARR